MLNTCFAKCVVLAAALFLLVPATMAADLDGAWDFVFVSDNGEHPRAITIKTNGEKVTAHLGEELFEGVCKDGKLELSGEYAGRLKIAKVNVDENQQLAADFGIRSIPTLLIFRDGVVQEQMVGAMGKAALKQKVEAYL